MEQSDNCSLNEVCEILGISRSKMDTHPTLKDELQDAGVIGKGTRKYGLAVWICSRSRAIKFKALKAMKREVI